MFCSCGLFERLVFSHLFAVIRYIPQQQQIVGWEFWWGFFFWQTCSMPRYCFVHGRSIKMSMLRARVRSTCTSGKEEVHLPFLEKKPDVKRLSIARNDWPA